MTTLKERADEYANADEPFAYPCQEKHLRRAYLAGARDALEMAAERFASTPKVAVYCDDAAETIRALLPDDDREPERTS